jgi:hypothetical protein
MISKEKSQNSLRALNHTIVIVRKLAHDEQAHSQLAMALDIVECLPRQIADPADRTLEFREYLCDLARRWPVFGSAIHYFDDPNLQWPW